MSLTSKSTPFWGSRRAQPDGSQPRRASSARHHRVTTAHGTGVGLGHRMGCLGGAPAGSLPTLGREQAIHRAWRRTGQRLLRVGANPAPQGCRTETRSRGLGRGRVVGPSLPAPATCYFGRNSGLERKEKGKLRACEDYKGKREGREKHGRRGKRKDWATGNRACNNSD